jgi:hypothetical protein
MRDKAAGLLQGLPLFQPGLVAIILRGKTDLFFEQYAERADTFEPDIIADLRDGKLFTGQPLAGLFYSLAGKILMRRSPVDAREKPVKMITGQTSLPGNTIQIDGLMKILVHIQFGYDDLLIYVRRNRHLKGRFFALIQI